MFSVTDDRPAVAPGLADAADAVEPPGGDEEGEDEHPAAATRPARAATEKARDLALWITRDIHSI
jgi:hypothetical protein